ncbi:MAG: heavy metal-associated domain-containing protein [Pacificimonas sp.]|jgi:copper chaperone CopZ|nr:heavy metal-associated domain-containing protein [Pacificimonas sp.]
MKTMLLAAILAAAPAAAIAQDHDHGDHSGAPAPAHDHAGESAERTEAATADTQGGTLIAVDVNGLVCDFCARALEKTFGKHDAVQAIDVDLDAKIVRIRTKPGASLGDAEVRQRILDAGYNVVGIRRS